MSGVCMGMGILLIVRRCLCGEAHIALHVDHVNRGFRILVELFERRWLGKFKGGV